MQLRIKNKLLFIAAATFFLFTLCLPSYAGAANYTYDANNRLLRVDYDDGSKIEYTYDESGNRTQKLTTPPDVIPDQFTFTDQINVPLNTVIISNAIIVSGINTAAPISINHGTYSINGAAYTSASGTVVNGNTVTVKKTSAATFSTTKNMTLTIGGVSDTFTITTLAADTIPDAFHFTDQTSVPLNTVITSNAITVYGINTATPITISNGTYSVNGAAYTSASGTVVNGNTVTVKKTSAATYTTTKNMILTIGGVSDTFSVTTLADPMDTTPDQFTFTDQINVPLSTVITSNAITVSGIGAASPISIVNGTYSINGAAYTSASGTVLNGNTVAVKRTSAAAYSTTKNAILTIGGVSDTFSVTTIPAP